MIGQKMMKPKTATFKFKPFSKKQRQVLNWWTDGSPVKEADGIIADGAIRSGKSLTMSLSFVLWAMSSFNGQNFAMCGKTVGSFRKNVLFWLKQMLDGRGYEYTDSRAENLFIVRRGDVENYFYIYGGRDERSQDLIQGITLAGLYLDEVVLMPQSFVNQATGRCSVDGSKMWFNCNPGSPSHWFKTGWIDEADEKNLLYLHFTMDDNLSLTERIKARYRSLYAGIFYQRFIEGLWVLAEGLVYQFGEDNITDEQPTGAEYYISVDYGTLNAFSAGLWSVTGEKATRIKEYYYSGRDEQKLKTDEEYCEDIQELAKGYRISKIIVDPSAASFITALRRRGYAVLKANNDVLDGIRCVSSLLRNGNIKIHRSCEDSIREFGLYSWDDNSSVDAVIKDNDHCLTGDTLVMTDKGNVPIKDLVGKKGKVWSYNNRKKKAELRPFNKCRLTKRKTKIFEIATADGKTIKCTKEHPILTERGYIQAKDLKTSDRIIKIEV